MVEANLIHEKKVSRQYSSNCDYSIQKIVFFKNYSLENYCCPKNLMVRRKNFMEQYRQIVTKILHFFSQLLLSAFSDLVKSIPDKKFFHSTDLQKQILISQKQYFWCLLIQSQGDYVEIPREKNLMFCVSEEKYLCVVLCVRN